MRISLATLDPQSPLTARIRAALARDAAARAAQSSFATTDAPPAPASPGRRSKRDSQVQPGQAPEVWRDEAALQTAIVAMITGEAKPSVIALHIPNGGKRSIGEARKLKGMGTTAGAPDLLIICDGKAHGLEVKTDRGTLSKPQKIMAERFRRAGSQYEVVRSVVGARQILARWGALATKGDQDAA